MTTNYEQIKKGVTDRIDIQTTVNITKEPELKQAKKLDWCYITNQYTT